MIRGCLVLALLLGSAVLHAQGETLRDKMSSGGEGPRLARVPAGAFVMGGGDGQSWLNGVDLPRHEVSIQKPFAIGVFEVSRGEYRRFVAATSRASTGTCRQLKNFYAYRSGDWTNPGFEQTDEHPVVCLSRDDAKAYLAWLSKETGKRYRLPTEAEWEYAARAGAAGKYVGGDLLEDICKYGNVWDRDGDRELSPPAKYCADGFPFTSPVGKFLPNGLGLFDMTGNAAEMIEDCFFENFDGAPKDGSAWVRQKCDTFAERGGSWSTEGEYLRIAHRTTLDADEYDSRTGFRVVREID